MNWLDKVGFSDITTTSVLITTVHIHSKYLGHYQLWRPSKLLFQQLRIDKSSSPINVTFSYSPTASLMREESQKSYLSRIKFALLFNWKFWCGKLTIRYNLLLCSLHCNSIYMFSSSIRTSWNKSRMICLGFTDISSALQVERTLRKMIYIDVQINLYC